MSGISSGVGLVSGLPTADLIAQMIQLERRPVLLMENRVAGIQTERTAWADLTARLLSAESFASRLSKSSYFKNYAATTSDESVLTAVAGENAVPGTYEFTVKSLVSNHQLVGKGLADANTTPIGAGTLSLEVGRGRINPDTLLDELNGGDGVRRGKILITDRSGASAEVDLSAAITLDDVVNKINTQTGIAVEAQVNGDRVVLRDMTGSIVNNLSVVDVRGGYSAQDLRLAQSVAADTINGADLMHLTDSTALTVLNDGNGIRHNVAGNDFRITQANGSSFNVSLAADLAQKPNTNLGQLNNGNGVRLGTIRLTDRTGATADVDLSAATTVQQVLNLINGAGVGVSATVGREHFIITDTTGVAGDDADIENLRIEDISGHAARDLGIALDSESSSFNGSDIFRITTIGDVLRAINYANGNDSSGNGVVASLSADGNGIVLDDQSTGTAALSIAALELNGVVSNAAADLGILGEFAAGTTDRRDLIAGPNTVLLSSLNGGSGITTKGTVSFTARDGTTTDIDFSSAFTLQEVLDLINATSTTSKLTAAANRAGNGIEITDTSGGTGPISITDSGGGTVAQDLGIAGTVAANQVNGGNLQLQYVNETTELADLNFGAGIRPGEFRITDSAGLVTSVKVTENQDSLQDIIALINAGVANVNARVNDSGDGLLITDLAGGDDALTIVDADGSSTAADLRIAGTAAEGETTIDGSYEISIDVDADDTLNDVMTKINSATSQVQASIINDGGTNGYRLALSSQVGGRRGEMVFDTGDTRLSMDTLVKAKDAVVFMGGGDGSSPLVITSSTNTLTDVAPGLTINLVGTSDKPVQLSVSQNVDQMVTDLEGFVSAYNTVLDRIEEYTAFNVETEERGVLLGSSTVQRIESRMYRSVTRSYANASSDVSRLFNVGLSIGSGGHLELDADKFRAAYAADPESVEALFTSPEVGVGAYLEEAFDELTRAGDGLITRADELLADKEQLLQERIDAQELLLNKKQIRLEAQFAALEESLAAMQSQQSALSSLSDLTAQ